MGTHLSFSTAFHPQSQGQVERVNQVLEDMLRACVISFGKKWEESLPYAEFSYNNGYQASLKMAPFEVLYGRKCRTPLNWSETGERSLVGPDIIQQAEEKVRIVREHLKLLSLVRREIMIASTNLWSINLASKLIFMSLQ